MEISTKLLSGVYTCYATIDGYDYSFEGGTMDFVQKQMKELIHKKGLQGKIKSTPKWKMLDVLTEQNLTSKPNSTIGYTKSRIDNNPIA